MRLPCALPEPLSPEDQTLEEGDEFAAVMAYHNGDAEAAVRTLLKDCKHLREQLALAQISMSLGFTRGWLPSFNRR
ncbi:hypothetical protein PYH37_004472 [Sinorhizobium numidicum]|uniref:Dehydrogenase n=1 Tax=Sinorhizobium numidicum TaxID=680248 RepID=A0ABY8CZJ2_9HYPH|nr:hypothetical protein [Sinorhizobium numidicum]WEX76188.1 hypothetical protein PYH37_004472 [Sinorhizobium numidicum]WEX82847.1 hypothetical protein PYH38_005184 [Sinorhizobium numidicum]